MLFNWTLCLLFCYFVWFAVSPHTRDATHCRVVFLKVNYRKMVVVDENFKQAGKTVGLQIWRIKVPHWRFRRAYVVGQRDVRWDFVHRCRISRSILWTSRSTASSSPATPTSSCRYVSPSLCLIRLLCVESVSYRYSLSVYLPYYSIVA